MEIKDIYKDYGDETAYVKLISVMGDEWTPAEDARMSTGKGRLGVEKDSKLQAHLLKSNHTSPFEGVLIKLELCVPLFVLREIDRHRTIIKSGQLELELPDEHSRKWFARNEMSGRYIKLPPLYYVPTKVRLQSKTNNQGDDNFSFANAEITNEFLERGIGLIKQVRELYDWAIENGIEKGVARIFNTQNQYTKIRMTGSLKNWCDFLNLRLREDVLVECRLVAEAIENILSVLFPSPMRQWRDNVYDSVRLSKDEAKILKELINYEYGFWDAETLCEGEDKKLANSLIEKLKLLKD